MVPGSKRGRGKTRIGSRNVVLKVGMWVIGYELSTHCSVMLNSYPKLLKIYFLF